MRPTAVVGQVVVQNAFCMVLVVDDDVVEAVPVEGADRRSQRALAWRLRRRVQSTRTRGRKSALKIESLSWTRKRGC